MTDWLDELRQHREAKQAQDQPTPEPPPPPDLLSQCKAYELLRQVQKALLDGEGLLNAPVTQTRYEQIMTLVWQGPVYAARKPKEDDPEDMYYILVGVRKGQVYVNGKKVNPITLEALKPMLVEAAKSPGVIKGKGVV
jgi:hypothetical protein